MTDSNPVPKFSREQLEYLEREFPTIEIRPDTSTNEIMFRAGQAEVLRWVARNLGFQARRPRDS